MSVHPFKKRGLPETELARVIAAQEDAVAEERRRELAAERARLYAERDAALAAQRRMVAARPDATPASQRAATAIRHALGTDWPAIIALVRQSRAEDLKFDLLGIEGSEEGQRRHAAVAKIGTDRAASRQAEAEARELRRVQAIAESIADQDNETPEAAHARRLLERRGLTE